MAGSGARNYLCFRPLAGGRRREAGSSQTQARKTFTETTIYWGELRPYFHPYLHPARRHPQASHFATLPPPFDFPRHDNPDDGLEALRTAAMASMFEDVYGPGEPQPEPLGARLDRVLARS